LIPEMIFTALIVGWILHGRFMRLADVRIKYVWMIFVPLGLYSAALAANHAHVFKPHSWVFGLAQAVGFLSMMVVAVANRSIPGVKVVFAGLALNAVAILANGGFMPAASDAVKSVYGSIPAGDTSATVRHAIIDAHTRLSFLCDVIAAKWPYALVRSVYSVGDVITSAGALIAIVAIMRNPAYSKQPVLKEA